MGSCTSTEQVEIEEVHQVQQPASEPSSRAPSLHFTPILTQNLPALSIPALQIDFDESDCQLSPLQNNIKPNKFDNVETSPKISPIASKIPSVSSHVYSTLGQKMEENDIFTDSDIQSDNEDQTQVINKLSEYQSIDWKNLKM